MSEILVFKNKDTNPITSVLQSINSQYLVSQYLVNEKAITTKATGENFSKLECIVLAFDSTFDLLSFSELDPGLALFIKNNKIDPKIPVMPIIYGAMPSETESLKKMFRNLAQKNRSINFLEEGLIWFKTESPEQFKNKLQKAEYKPAALPNSKRNTYDLSDKGAAIRDAIIIGVSIFLGVILGPIAGGLIGGLALGGPVAGIIGAGIGLVAGPILGFLIASSLIILLEGREVAKERSKELQEKRDWQAGEALWNIFTANFFPDLSSSISNTDFEADSQELSSGQESKLRDGLKIGYSAVNRQQLQNIEDDEGLSSNLNLSR